jgi:predicted transposase YdaD
VRGKVKVEKTELSREPIRADSVLFSREESEILHAEFQTTMKSKTPVPLRFLDYYVGLKRKYPRRRIRQALVLLKPTGEEIPDHYEDENTWHRFTVIKMWEQDPAFFLRHKDLLPLATLCRTDSGEDLLKAVAAKINRIKSRTERREALGWSHMRAGRRYDKDPVSKIFKESDMLEESVTYQDVLQKGEQRGERKFAWRMLERQFGKLPKASHTQFEQLVIEQVEALGDALPDLKTRTDLTRWLNKHAPAQLKQA